VQCLPRTNVVLSKKTEHESNEDLTH